jgi:hypothetical protein
MVMCGDIEEQTEAETALWERFQADVGFILAHRPAGATPERIHAYMEGLFRTLMQKCLSDAQAGADAREYQLLAMQPLVLARLAGFMAAHLSLAEDPLRKVVEALMHGYGEVDALERARRDHAHGHDHGAGESHSH